MGMIVGRARELAEVSRDLGDVRRGQGRLLLISGPAGIGKTSLATAAAAEAECLGMAVARGWAVDDPGAPVLWPWSRVLRGWAGPAAWPDAAADGEPDAATRFRLFATAKRELAAMAGHAGLLVVLDDMHWGHLWRFDAAMQLGNIGAAEQELADIDRIAAERKSVVAAWHHNRLSAVLAALAGDFAAARANTAAARALAVRCADVSMTGMSSAFQLQLAVLRGDPAELDDEFLSSVRSAPPVPVVRISYPLWHAVEGRLDQAREEFEEFRQLPETFPHGVR
ncbi:ATP-binding protein [Trebonia kvetii]|nr:ATP-binding protein [Trebonia kvetii]